MSATSIIQFPAINVPAGCEDFAEELLRTMTQQIGFMANPAVVSDAAKRTMTTSLEHSLGSAREQALSLASAAKRRKTL